TQKFDEQAQVPYAYKDNHWISFENNRSITEKLKLLKSQNLGGAISSTIDADDFSGKCGKQHALERVILETLDPQTVLVDRDPPTEPPPFLKDGVFRDINDCQLYYVCSAGQRSDYECRWQEFFDEAKSECRPMKEVKCEVLEAALKARELCASTLSM
ncbi:endochitinase-like, partial [Drosophila miranda]|uniref:endochitinase-like n=1 Tax=Drosophila miranda TaxID=7229 RepID=UPI00143F8542